MSHIKKINEINTKRNNVTLKDLVLGIGNCVYEMTINGLVAVYGTFYNEYFIHDTIDFYEYINKYYENNKNGFIDREVMVEIEKCLKSFLYDRIMREVNEDEFVNAIYSNNIMKHIGTGSHLFVELPNTHHRNWGEDVSRMLGIKLKK